MLLKIESGDDCMTMMEMESASTMKVLSVSMQILRTNDQPVFKMYARTFSTRNFWQVQRSQ